MTINNHLSLKGCWRMVNAIQKADTPEEIRRRCNIAADWLLHNDEITNDQYNDLMLAVTFFNRESYKKEA